MIRRWKEKIFVSYISTEFDNDMMTIINNRGQESIKPQAIVKYMLL